MPNDGMLMVSSELLFRAEDRITELEAQLRRETDEKVAAIGYKDFLQEEIAKTLQMVDTTSNAIGGDALILIRAQLRQERGYREAAVSELECSKQVSRLARAQVAQLQTTISQLRLTIETVFASKIHKFQTADARGYCHCGYYEAHPIHALANITPKPEDV